MVVKRTGEKPGHSPAPPLPRVPLMCAFTWSDVVIEAVGHPRDPEHVCRFTQHHPHEPHVCGRCGVHHSPEQNSNALEPVAVTATITSTPGFLPAPPAEVGARLVSRALEHLDRCRLTARQKDVPWHRNQLENLLFHTSATKLSLGQAEALADEIRPVLDGLVDAAFERAATQLRRRLLAEVAVTIVPRLNPKES